MASGEGSVEDGDQSADDVVSPSGGYDVDPCGEPRTVLPAAGPGDPFGLGHFRAP